MAAATKAFRPFQHLTAQELCTLLTVSKLMTYSWFVRNSSKLIGMSQAVLGKRASEFYIKHTVASVFSAGESVEDVRATIQTFKKYVNPTQPFYPIIDFAAEGVHDPSLTSEMDSNASDVISGILEAGKSPHSASAVKFTALTATPLLRKIAALQTKANRQLVAMGVNGKEVEGLFTGSLFPLLAHAASPIYGLPSHPSLRSLLSELSEEDLGMLQAFLARVLSISSAAKAHKVAILIDAEQSYFQPAVDALTYDLQRLYNQKQPVINATFQCYLKETDQKLPAYIRISQQEGVKLGAKLVRGAYIIEENRLAGRESRESPVHKGKPDTDKCYNANLGLFIEAMQQGDKLVVASHNADSVALGQRLMQERGLGKTSGGVSFAQLMGMKHKLSVQLAQAGYITQKYMPFGPISRLVPYLARRAHESYGIKDQIQDQVADIVKELKFRALPRRN